MREELKETSLVIRVTDTAAQALAQQTQGVVHRLREAHQWWGAVFVYQIYAHQFAVVTVTERTGPPARGEAERAVRAVFPAATPRLVLEQRQDGQVRVSQLSGPSHAVPCGVSL